MEIFKRVLMLGRADPKSRTVPVTLSTEAPVDRGSYIEILDHHPRSVDLSRGPLPLIESHDSGELNIGLVEDLKLVGRTLKGVARFGTSQRAQEVFQDVTDGIVRSVSVGYQYTGPGVADPADPDGDTLRFTWCPIELSAVSIPADPSAGFYRHLTLEKNMGTTNTNTEQSHQTRSQKRAATGELDRIALSNQEERNRCAEITAMGRAHNCPDLAEDLVRENVDLAQAREAVLDWVTSRRPRQLPANRDYTDAGDYIDMHNEAKDFSIVRAINAVVNSSWKGAGLERAASEAVAKRIGRESSGGFFFPLDARLTRSPYSTGGGNTGAALLATNLLASSFIEVLRNKVRVIELGATMLSGLVGNVDIPRRSAATPISWIGEAGSLTDGEGTLDKLQLAPKTVGALSTISRNMLMQSTPDIEMLVRSDMIAVLGLGIDLAAINGLGSANQPLGILNTVGVGQVVLGTNGAQISLDNLLDLVKTVMNANADAGSLAFLTNPSVVGFLSKLKATTNQYLWDRGENQNNFGPVSGSGVGGQNLLSAVGQKMAITNQVPSNLTKGTANGTCSAVIFGNWQDVVIGEWGVLEILPNPYDSVQYPKGSVLIRALQTIDIGIRHPQSFAIINDALTV